MPVSDRYDARKALEQDRSLDLHGSRTTGDRCEPLDSAGVWTNQTCRSLRGMRFAIAGRTDAAAGLHGFPHYLLATEFFANTNEPGETESRTR